MLMLIFFVSLQVRAQGDSEAIQDQWHYLLLESKHCFSDYDCTLLPGTACFNPCGGISVNPERVAELLALEKEYLAAGGNLCPVPACPTQRGRKAVCVEGSCSSAWPKVLGESDAP